MGAQNRTSRCITMVNSHIAVSMSCEALTGSMNIMLNIIQFIKSYEHDSLEH